MNSVTIEAVDISPTIGTNCQICDAFIPIVSARNAYPRICDECKKRLKELLYPKEEEHEKTNKG